MTDQHETPEFRPVGDEWEPCEEPGGAPLEFQKLGGTWWRLPNTSWTGGAVLAVQRDGIGSFIYHSNDEPYVPFPGPAWEYQCANNVSSGQPWSWVGRHYALSAPRTAEQRRVQALRELPDQVMRRLAEARHKHPEPQSLAVRLVALQSEVTEVIDAALSGEGTDRINDELLDVIVVAVRALSEELTS